jgi:hypothetical protein
MMMKYISAIVFGFSVVLLPISSYACSCADNGSSFVQIAKRSKLVIRGKVTEYHWRKDDKNINGIPLSMTVDVKEIYQGTTKLSKVIVWGDNGIICRPYVTQFPIGTEWVLALSEDSWTKKGELAISACGAYWLSVQRNNVIGKVTKGSSNAKPQVMSLPDLRKLLKAAP